MTSFSPTQLGEDARDHDGTCDFDDGGCGQPMTWALIEDAGHDFCPGGPGVSYHGSLAYYCDLHVRTAPIATRAEVEIGVAVHPCPTWMALVEAYPEPVRVDVSSR